MLAAALASGLAVVLVGDVGVAYATGIVTFLIVVFAAVLPKTYALAYSDRVALLLAPIMRVVIVVLNPVTIAIEFIVRQLLKLTPTHGRRRGQHPRRPRGDPRHDRAADQGGHGRAP